MGKEQGGGGVAGHKSHHIIVTHQPKGSNKGRHAVLSPVQCRPRLLPLSEKRERRRAASAIPSLLIPPPTQRKTDYHSCKNKIKTPKNSSTRKQTENFKNQNKRKKQIKTAEVKLAGSQSAAAAAVVTHILPLRCLSPHTHTSPPLALTHTHR